MPDASQNTQRTVVIGGGLSGLVTAYTIASASNNRVQHREIRLLEARERLGGAIWTERRDGFTLECGADSFITNKPWGVELCDELGLRDRLIETDRAKRRSFVVRRGRLVPVPEGFVMAAPSRLVPVLTSPILSLGGKLRLLLDLVIPRRDSQTEESLASFVRRRLGRQALERLVQPLVGGIYTADPNELSLQATMPQFARMEHEFGSLIRGAVYNAKQDRRAQRGASGARYGLFVTLDDGMDVLTNTLATKLPPDSLHRGSAVRRIWRADATANAWRVEMLDGSSIDAGAVVIATEAHAAARLLESHDSSLAMHLRSIPYASSIVVNAAYQRDAIAHPLDGFGAVVPAVEGLKILAISFTSIKFPSRAPKGSVLLRVFLGGALQPEICELDDSAIQSLVQSSLQRLIGAQGAPLWTQISRHTRAMPQYTLGHLERVDAVRQHLQKHPGLFITGNAFDGVGIPDCIRGAQQTGRDLLAYLNALVKAAA